MPDPTTTTEPGQEPGQTPQDPTGQDPEGDFDKERALATIRKLREFEKTAKGQLRELETLKAQATEAERAKLSETERLRAEAEEAKSAREKAERKAQERITRAEALTIASRLGIVDPDAAYRLLDGAAIKYGEDGEPANLEPLLKDLLKAKPYLKGQQQGPSSPSNPARGGGAQGESDEERRQRLFGGGISTKELYSPERARQRGGGVFISTRSLSADQRPPGAD